MQLVELSQNGVSALLSHPSSRPILQVVNLMSQSDHLLRIALSDGNQFIQTLATKILVDTRQIERLSLLKVLEFTFEGNSSLQVVYLRDVEVLKTVSYVVGAPSPIRHMTVATRAEIQQSSSIPTAIAVYRCRECREMLAALRTVAAEKCIFARLANSHRDEEKLEVETDTGTQLVQTVKCVCGLEVGRYYLAATTASLRGKYQLLDSAIDVLPLPDCTEQPSDLPTNPKRRENSENIAYLQGEIGKSVAEYSKRVSVVERERKAAEEKLRSWKITSEGSTCSSSTD